MGTTLSIGSTSRNNQQGAGAHHARKAQLQPMTEVERGLRMLVRMIDKTTAMLTYHHSLGPSKFKLLFRKVYSLYSC